MPVTASPPASEHSYWAFISYSHRDMAWAVWLHKRLETYRDHKRLVGTTNRRGEVVPARIFPVFRDRDELEGAPDLPERISEALVRSRYLIVICSPQAAASRWVDQEIRTFKAMGRDDRVLALIVDGEPHSSSNDDPRNIECFPIALRHRVNPQRELDSERAEPIAADARPGRDGKRQAFLKIAAAILGVRFDELRQRDRERRRRRALLAAAATTVITAIVAALIWDGARQRRQAQEEATIGRSRELVVSAMKLTASQLDLALLLAVEAFSVSPTDEARSALWQMLSSSAPVRFLASRGPSLHLVAVDAAGQRLVSASTDEVALWDITRGHRIATLPDPPRAAARVGFASTQPATISEDDDLAVWPEQGGPRIVSLRIDDVALVEACFSHGGSLLSTVDGNGAVSVWELAQWPPIRRTLGKVRTGGGLAFHLDDSRVVVYDNAEQLVVTFDVQRGTELSRVAVEEPEPASTLSLLSPDGSRLASVDFELRLRLWSAVTGRPSIPRRLCPVALRGLTGGIAFTRDGKTLAVAETDGEVSFIDATSGLRAGSLRAGTGSDSALVYAADDKRLFVGTNAGALMEWGPMPYSPESRIARYVSPCGNDTPQQVAISADGVWLAATCNDGTVAAVSVAAGPVVRRVIRTDADPRSDPGVGLGVSHDGSMAVVTYRQGRRALVRFRDGQLEWLAENDDRGVAAAASGDGRTLATLTTGGTVSLWNTATGERRDVRLSGAEDEWRAFGLDAAGNTIVAATGRGRLSVGTVGNGTEVVMTALAGTVDAAAPVQVSADGRQVTAMADQRQWRMWNLRAPDTPPAPSVASDNDFVTPSPDGRFLAVSQLGRVSLLRMPSGTSFATLADTTGSAMALRFSGDGLVFAAWYGGSAVNVWDLDPRAWIAHACTIANRTLTQDEARTYLAGAASTSPCSALNGERR